MIFRRELAVKIIGRRKTATRRCISGKPKSPWARNSGSYPVGKVFAINPGRGAVRVAEAKVTARYLQRFEDVDEIQARQEGFTSLAEFQEAFAEINARRALAGELHVVEFECVTNGLVVIRSGDYSGKRGYLEGVVEATGAWRVHLLGDYLSDPAVQCDVVEMAK